MIASMLAVAMAGGGGFMAPCVTPPDAAKTVAKEQSWFINNVEISFDSRQFRKYGLPRVLTPAEIRVAGAYKGAAVYLPSDPLLGTDVIYLPVDLAACEFQPYVVKT